MNEKRLTVSGQSFFIQSVSRDSTPWPAPGIAVANPKLSLTFCKTPSGRSCTEPSTGHYAMNISPPNRTTFSGLSSFYTVLWHITLKAIRKKQYSSRASNTPPPGQPKFSLSFCKTPSGRSSTEPSTGHYVMNISPPIARLFQAYRHSTLFCGTLL